VDNSEQSGKPEARPRRVPVPATPVDEAWIATVTALPAEQQGGAVAEKLKALNPDFDGIYQSRVENGFVVDFQVATDLITDLTPVRGLKQLRVLRCQPAVWGASTGRLASLEVVRGLPLTALHCGGNPALSDLTPVAGMKLTELDIHRTSIADLSPVRG